MSTLAILQARMTSTRFPGKVLAPLAGQPMVIRQLERIQRANELDGIVVATSEDSSDDLLAATVEAFGVPVVRGSLDNVLERFVTVIDRYQPQVVVRLTADCPLTSPAVIDEVVCSFHASGVDYASNTMQPTFPDGLDVEVVRAQVLREIARESTDRHELEHVTLGVYRRHQEYTIVNFKGEEDHSDLRWTVDTREDYEFICGVYDALFNGNPEFEYVDVLEYIRQHPDRSRTAADIRRNSAIRGLDTGAMNT